MNRLAAILCASVLAATLVVSTSSAGGARIGAGVHYWKTLDEVKTDEIEESGLSWIATCQFGSSYLLKFQTDLEIFPEEFAGFKEIAYAPQAFIILGRTIYGGLGIGAYYTEGEFSKKLFYLVRAGLDLELVPRLYLDINANYRFEDWDEPEEIVEDIDTDVITLGAAVRIAF